MDGKLGKYFPENRTTPFNLGIAHSFVCTGEIPFFRIPNTINSRIFAALSICHSLNPPPKPSEKDGHHSSRFTASLVTLEYPPRFRLVPMMADNRQLAVHRIWSSSSTLLHHRWPTSRENDQRTRHCSWYEIELSPHANSQSHVYICEERF